ncbi:MAG TPA: hypothetical protein VMY37_35830 [Thermoguttaceae bacterium]|nr:hypothetical protein [Thermoguttaceae bacterium]
MGKKKKYLIETSAVPAALGESTPAHCARFVEVVADGTCWTSIYIRKEFVRRWIRYYVRMAFCADYYQDLSSALYDLEQDFSIRDVKTGQHALATFLRDKGAVQNGRTLAKELAHFAVVALRKFDHRFQKRTNNSCGCKIGGTELNVDFNHLFDDLRCFLESIDVVADCPINSFLRLNKPGPASRLLSQPDVVEKTKSGEKLAKLRAASRHITCKECQTIGDAVIALDQPPSWCLVHIDKDFCILCKAANREQKLLPSLRAVEKDAPKL